MVQLLARPLGRVAACRPGTPAPPAPRVPAAVGGRPGRWFHRPGCGRARGLRGAPARYGGNKQQARGASLS